MIFLVLVFAESQRFSDIDRKIQDDPFNPDPEQTLRPTVSSTFKPTATSPGPTPRTAEPTISPVVVTPDDGNSALFIAFIALTSVAVIGAVASSIYFLSTRNRNAQIMATPTSQEDNSTTRTRSRIASVPVKSIYSVNTVVL